MDQLLVDVDTVPRAELPALLGRLAELQARAYLRLHQHTDTPNTPTLLNDCQAAALAGVSPRWLRQHTQGLGFRRDLSRKASRFDQAGLLAWLGNRRTRQSKKEK